MRAEVQDLVVISRSHLARFKLTSAFIDTPCIRLRHLDGCIIRISQPRGIIDGAGHSLLKWTVQIIIFSHVQLLSVELAQWGGGGAGVKARRSEERRVGKEGRDGWWRGDCKE